MRESDVKHVLTNGLMGSIRTHVRRTHRCVECNRCSLSFVWVLEDQNVLQLPFDATDRTGREHSDDESPVAATHNFARGDYPTEVRTGGMVSLRVAHKLSEHVQLLD